MAGNTGLFAGTPIAQYGNADGLNICGKAP
jgi:hypothetical protein